MTGLFGQTIWLKITWTLSGAKLRVELCCGSPLTWDVPPGEKVSGDASHACPVQNSAAVCGVQSSKAIHFWKIHWNR